MPTSFVSMAGPLIWALLAAIFLLDLLTPADDVSVCFAYMIPIFVSLFETKSRAPLYAACATALSLAGMAIQPPHFAITVLMVMIAVSTQWIVAALVRVQRKRLAEAVEQAEAQRRFVDILSHEVGTALTTVTGQAYRLTKLSDQLAPDDLKVRADKIRRAAERIQAIISRIQFASSLGDGSIPSGDRVINLTEMLHQLADHMRDVYRDRMIVLNPACEPLFVTGDETLLGQLFENAIANGIKYSPPDGPITVDIVGCGEVVRVTVTDHGVGIPENELSLIRAAYYRGRNSKGISGAGLGLYVVERLVDAHHGFLAIESEVGAGTKVVVELPRTEVQAAS